AGGRRPNRTVRSRSRRVDRRHRQWTRTARRRASARVGRPRAQGRQCAPADARRRLPAAHGRTRHRHRRIRSCYERCRMTAIALPIPDEAGVANDADIRIPVTAVVSDALAVARRNLIALMRVPTTVVFSTVQPVIFVLMFRYVFGGAIRVPGVRYVDFLMAGIFVQTVTFGAMNTGVGLAMDLQTGLIERFRSLPMARSAVLAGRTIADAVRNLFVIALMVLVGFAVGFRVHTGVLEFGGAILLLLLFGVAFSWIMAYIGLSTGNAEAAQAASFPLMAVFVFAARAVVSTATMPGPLRVYADHQPVTATVNAVRPLVIGGPTWDKVLAAVAWTVGITVVFAALSVRRYRHAAGAVRSRVCGGRGASPSRSSRAPARGCHLRRARRMRRRTRPAGSTTSSFTT